MTRCPKCGGEVSCHSCVDGERSSQFYTPGDWDFDGGNEPTAPPEACETCDMPYVNHRCKCGHEEKVRP